MQTASNLQDLTLVDNSEEIRRRDRRFVWHPWSPLSEDRSRLTFSRGEGYQIWDIDGNCYIDCCSLNLTCGYANENITKPIYQQLLKFHGTDISLASHEPVGLLAERLASLLPDGLSKTLFVNSGSEGIEAAIFIAASYWAQIGNPRHRLISFASGYHGSTFFSRSISKLPRVGQPFAQPIPTSHIEFQMSPSELRRPESLKPLLEAFEESIKCEKNEPAMAVLVEPFLNVGGGIQLPNGFLRELSKLCHDNGVLLILDEVFTGYSRTGKLFAFQHEGIIPDILVSSKGLAGGYMPITAVTVQERIHDTFDKDLMLGGLRYGHTTSGHAVSCVAALATLDFIESEKLSEKAKIHGEVLLEKFSPYAARGNVVDVRGFGLILVLEMASFEIGTQLRLLAESKGLLVRQCGPSIMVVPPLTIDSNGIQKVSNILNECLTIGGFLC